MIMQRPMPPTEHKERAGEDGDAMQASQFTARIHAPELDGQEEMGPPLAWVSLEAERGLLVCDALGLEVRQFIGTVAGSRVVRVMQDGDGTVLCASSDRLMADIGRPGRECQACEEKGACCFPRWLIAWQEVVMGQDEGSGQIFTHTLCRTGTLNFTRYAARLRREGLTPGRVTTRLFVEDAGRQTPGPVRRHVQFERVTSEEEPFAGN